MASTTGLSSEERRSASELGPEWDGYSTFTVEEAGCKILRLSRDSAYEAARTGALPTLRIGRRLIVPRRALERMLEAHERARLLTSRPHPQPQLARHDTTPSLHSNTPRGPNEVVPKNDEAGAPARTGTGRGKRSK
jgi:excisionase family DNA binding protein